MLAWKRTRRRRAALVTLLTTGLALLLTLVAPARLLAAEPPQIASPHAIVLDPDTGQVIFERDSRARVAPASLTKVMTALVAIEHTDLAETIAVTRDDLIGEASMGLRAGEAVSLATLLYGLMLPSGNDAAMAIARGVGARPGDATGQEAVARFVGWMNETAARLGLRDTHFANPHGLDADGHYSSAYDLARLTGIAWRDPLFARIFAAPRYTAEGHALTNSHRLIGKFDGVVGGKIGLTDGCGFCLVTAAERGDRRLVVVVLRDTVAEAYADTTALLAWTYGQLDAGLLPSRTVALPPRQAPSLPPPAAPANAITPSTLPAPGNIALAAPPALLPEPDRLRPIAIAILATLIACGLVRRLLP